MTKEEQERLLDRAISFIKYHTKKSSMILGKVVIEELEQVKKCDLADGGYIDGQMELIAQIKQDVSKILKDPQANDNLMFDIINLLRQLDKK